MAAILDVLRGSSNAVLDRQNFLRAQFLFWLMAAPDGHAKNFSISLERGGAYRLTQLYDVLSAWPVILGDGPNRFQWKKVTMAMAVHGKNAHYKMSEIQRRHWNEVARRNGLGVDFEESIHSKLERARGAIDEVAQDIPSDFPAAVSDTIFEGIRSQVAAVARQT